MAFFEFDSEMFSNVSPEKEGEFKSEERIWFETKPRKI